MKPTSTSSETEMELHALKEENAFRTVTQKN